MLERMKLNGTQLKLIAIITMLTDHIGAAVLEQNPDLQVQYAMQYNLMRAIGRIAFPIFCYLSVQGFMHTRNIKKYIVRLLLFAIIAEIPFDLAFFDSYFFMEYNNVIWSILIGIMMLFLMQRYEQNMLIVFGALVAGCGLGVFLRTDYLYIAPLLMYVFYRFRNDKRIQLLAGAILMCLQYLRFNSLWALTAVFSFVLIYFYDGTKGRGMKYLFYLFYPLHLLILNLIRKVFFVGWM